MTQIFPPALSEQRESKGLVGARGRCHRRQVPRRKKSTLTPVQETLYHDIRAVLLLARSSAYRAVHTAMVQAYWQVGRLIVEHEQGGRKRATYGQSVLGALSQRLTIDFGKGFTRTNLKYMRSFYVALAYRAVRFSPKLNHVTNPVTIAT
jgi:hypothetical protein